MWIGGGKEGERAGVREYLGGAIDPADGRDIELRCNLYLVL